MHTKCVGDALTGLGGMMSFLNLGGFPLPNMASLSLPETKKGYGSSPRCISPRLGAGRLIDLLDLAEISNYHKKTLYFTNRARMQKPRILCHAMKVVEYH
jgi:hypothetical protein